MKILLADLDCVSSRGVEFLPTDIDRVHAFYSDVYKELPLLAVEKITDWATRGILTMETFGNPFERDREKLIRKLIYLAGNYARNGNELEIMTEDRLLRELGNELMSETGYTTGPYKVADLSGGSCTMAKSLKVKVARI